MPIDPMTSCNRHVRAFADRHGLRTVIRDDGEVAIRVGARSSEGHASYGFKMPGQRGLTWQTWVLASPRSIALAARALEVAGGVVEVLDGELLVNTAEADLLRVLDSCHLTKPQRVRNLSPEAREAAAARMRAVRSRAAVPGPV